MTGDKSRIRRASHSSLTTTGIYSSYRRLSSEGIFVTLVGSRYLLRFVNAWRERIATSELMGLLSNVFHHSTRIIGQKVPIMPLSCYAKPVKKPTDKTPPGRENMPLSGVQSLYDCRAKVTHTPSTSESCETRARPVGKFIASLAFRLC
jgi:hypothetical protein